MAIASTVQRTAFVQRLYEGPKEITIFGREPTVWMGFIEAALGVVVAFGLGIGLGLSQETFGIFIILIEAIFGFVVAFLTKDTMLGVSMGLVKAIIAFVAIYQIELSDQQVGSILTLVPILVLMWQRPQTAPIAGGEVIPRDAPPLAVSVVPPEEYPPEAVTSEPPAEGL